MFPFWLLPDFMGIKSGECELLHTGPHEAGCRTVCACLTSKIFALSLRLADHFLPLQPRAHHRSWRQKPHRLVEGGRGLGAFNRRRLIGFIRARRPDKLVKWHFCDVARPPTDFRYSAAGAPHGKIPAE